MCFHRLHRPLTTVLRECGDDARAVPASPPLDWNVSLNPICPVLVEPTLVI
jgi:hypothetical protein